MNMNIGIVGPGVVGKAVANGLFERLNPTWEVMKPQNQIIAHDKYHQGIISLECGASISCVPLDYLVENSFIIFVSVPTPSGKNGINLEIIDSVIEDMVKYYEKQNFVDVKIVVIKSTVIPGTIDRYNEKYKDTSFEFVFNPEFLRQKYANEDFMNQEFIVLGGEPEVCDIVEDLYRKAHFFCPVLKTTPKTAEMVKYYLNCLEAVKIGFANEIYDICGELDINYEEVKNIAVLDSAYSRRHLDITEERGFGGACLPKDLAALVGLKKQLGLKSGILESLEKYNRRIRNE